MEKVIKKPISIMVYEYETSYRVASYFYNMKNKEPKRLHDEKTCQNETELAIHLRKLETRFDVQDICRHGKKDKEVEYPPHMQMKVYKWTPAELSAIIRNFLRNTYENDDIGATVEFDHYNGNFSVEFHLDVDEYDNVYDAIMDDYTYDHEGFIPNGIEGSELLSRILRDIVGYSFVMARPEDQSVYNYGEQTWTNDTEPAYFFFE